MKALLKTQRGPGLEIAEIPAPKPSDNEVLIKVQKSAICGSDLKILHWMPPVNSLIEKFPFVPGHECSGTVVEVGRNVKKFKAGDRVAVDTHISCGRCWQCLNGRAHTCENMLLFGHQVNGCFAEYVAVSERAVFALPDEVDYETGCLFEPMGIPFRAVERGNVKGETVLIIGCGPIGLFAIAFSRLLDASRIIAADINPYRLELAKKLGADISVNSQQSSFVEVIREASGFEKGLGVIIEASGSVKTLKEAITATRVGARVMCIGHSQEALSLKLSPEIVLRELEIVGFFGREIWDTWEKVSTLVKQNSEFLKQVITHRFNIEEYKSAFHVAEEGSGGKVVFDFEQ